MTLPYQNSASFPEAEPQRVGKSWNRKGSKSAHVRMSELRSRKAEIAKTAAIKAWCERRGIPFDSQWLKAAEAAGYDRRALPTDQMRRQWFEEN